MFHASLTILSRAYFQDTTPEKAEHTGPKSLQRSTCFVVIMSYNNVTVFW